jgi:hypothetical protein
MASYGNENELIWWHNDPRDAAAAAMDFLIANRQERHLVIRRWDGKNDARPDRKVNAFRLERLDGSGGD